MFLYILIRFPHAVVCCCLRRRRRRYVCMYRRHSYCLYYIWLYVRVCVTMARCIECSFIIPNSNVFVMFLFSSLKMLRTLLLLTNELFCCLTSAVRVTCAPHTYKFLHHDITVHCCSLSLSLYLSLSLSLSSFFQNKIYTNFTRSQ